MMPAQTDEKINKKKSQGLLIPVDLFHLLSLYPKTDVQSKRVLHGKSRIHNWNVSKYNDQLIGSLSSCIR